MGTVVRAAAACMHARPVQPTRRRLEAGWLSETVRQEGMGQGEGDVTDQPVVWPSRSVQEGVLGPSLCRLTWQVPEWGCQVAQHALMLMDCAVLVLWDLHCPCMEMAWVGMGD